MRYYEAMVIIHPALETSRLKELILGIHENVKRKDGTLISTNLWGRKRLAYLIEKQKYGTYVLLQFSGDKFRSTDFNTDLEHDTNILAYMTVKIEQDQVKEQESDLDTQIAGTVREEARAHRAEASATPKLDSNDVKTESEPESNTEEDTTDTPVVPDEEAQSDQADPELSDTETPAEIDPVPTEETLEEKPEE